MAPKRAEPAGAGRKRPKDAHGLHAEVEENEPAIRHTKAAKHDDRAAPADAGGQGPGAAAVEAPAQAHAQARQRGEPSRPRRSTARHMSYKGMDVMGLSESSSSSSGSGSFGSGDEEDESGPEAAVSGEGGSEEEGEDHDTPRGPADGHRRGKGPATDAVEAAGGPRGRGRAGAARAGGREGGANAPAAAGGVGHGSKRGQRARSGSRGRREALIDEAVDEEDELMVAARRATSGAAGPGPGSRAAAARGSRARGRPRGVRAAAGGSTHASRGWGRTQLGPSFWSVGFSTEGLTTTTETGAEGSASGAGYEASSSSCEEEGEEVEERDGGLAALGAVGFEDPDLEATLAWQRKESARQVRLLQARVRQAKVLRYGQVLGLRGDPSSWGGIRALRRLAKERGVEVDESAVAVADSSDEEGEGEGGGGGAGGEGGAELPGVDGLPLSERLKQQKKPARKRGRAKLVVRAAYAAALGMPMTDSSLWPTLKILREMAEAAGVTVDEAAAEAGPGAAAAGAGESSAGAAGSGSEAEGADGQRKKKRRRRGEQGPSLQQQQRAQEAEAARERKEAERKMQRMLTGQHPDALKRKGRGRPKKHPGRYDHTGQRIPYEQWRKGRAKRQWRARNAESVRLLKGRSFDQVAAQAAREEAEEAKHEELASLEVAAGRVGGPAYAAAAARAAAIIAQGGKKAAKAIRLWLPERIESGGLYEFRKGTGLTLPQLLYYLPLVLAKPPGPAPYVPGSFASQPEVRQRIMWAMSQPGATGGTGSTSSIAQAALLPAPLLAIRARFPVGQVVPVWAREAAQAQQARMSRLGLPMLQGSWRMGRSGSATGTAAGAEHGAGQINGPAAAEGGNKQSAGGAVDGQGSKQQGSQGVLLWEARLPSYLLIPPEAPYQGQETKLPMRPPSTLTLGTYLTPEEAAMAIDQALLALRKRSMPPLRPQLQTHQQSAAGRSGKGGAPAVPGIPVPGADGSSRGKAQEEEDGGRDAGGRKQRLWPVPLNMPEAAEEVPDAAGGGPQEGTLYRTLLGRELEVHQAVLKHCGPGPAAVLPCPIEAHAAVVTRPMALPKLGCGRCRVCQDPSALHMPCLRVGSLSGAWCASADASMRAAAASASSLAPHMHAAASILRRQQRDAVLAVAQLSGQSDTVRVTLSSLTPAAAAATSTSEPGRDIPKAAAVEAGLTAASAAVGAGPGPGSLVGCHSGEAEHVLLAAEVAGPAQHPLLALQEPRLSRCPWCTGVDHELGTCPLWALLQPPAPSAPTSPQRAPPAPAAAATPAAAAGPSGAQGAGTSQQAAQQATQLLQQVQQQGQQGPGAPSGPLLQGKLSRNGDVRGLPVGPGGVAAAVASAVEAARKGGGSAESQLPALDRGKGSSMDVRLALSRSRQGHSLAELKVRKEGGQNWRSVGGPHQPAVGPLGLLADEVALAHQQATAAAEVPAWFQRLAAQDPTLADAVLAMQQVSVYTVPTPDHPALPSTSSSSKVPAGMISAPGEPLPLDACLALVVLAKKTVEFELGLIPHDPPRIGAFRPVGRGPGPGLWTTGPTAPSAVVVEEQEEQG